MTEIRTERITYKTPWMKVSASMILILMAGVFVGLLSGCGEEVNDADKLSNNTAGAATLAFPDGFSNVAAKCFGTDMVYAAVNTNGRAVAVSPNHPWCADGILTKDEQNR